LTIGEGLVMTRNEAAILGRRMTFPELAFTTRRTKGASGQGGLWFDFRALGAARAVHLRSDQATSSASSLPTLPGPRSIA
jgi:hypothetical protein